MAGLHQRPFSAAEVGSVFSTEVGMPAQAVGVGVSRKYFRQLDIRQNENKKEYSESSVLSETTYKVSGITPHGLFSNRRFFFVFFTTA